MPYKSLNTINPKNLFTTKENLVDMKGRLKMNLKKIHLSYRMYQMKYLE